jgi:hypothetical protein
MKLEARDMRLVGAHHTTVLVNCPPAVQYHVLRQWRGGDTGINWHMIRRWIAARPDLPQPISAEERSGRFVGHGAYAHSWSDGRIEWPEKAVGIRVAHFPDFEPLPDIP